MKITHLFAVFVLLTFSLTLGCQNDSDNVADKRDNIEGDWHMTLDDGQVPVDYQVTISKDANSTTKIFMSNFVNNGSKAYATITGMNLTIPEQQVGNETVSGDGTISSDYNTITWNLTIDGDSYTGKMVPGGITKKELAR
jgi:hypothetical protein